MKQAVLMSGVAIGFALSSPAQAAVTIDGGQVTVTGVDDTFNVSFNGLSDGQVVRGLSSLLTLTVISVGSNWVFKYSLDNTGAGTVTGFGFNVSPDVVGVMADGTYGNESLGFKAAGFRAETCFQAGSGSCPNGNHKNISDPGTGTLTLQFGSAKNEITLSNFVNRTQSFQIGNVSSAVGQGTPVSPVPEPATWAMMLLGFGLVGAAMRRRGNTTHRVRFAV
ncbi:cistern family PEP-CTERM protein [Erythrobacter sp. sf7]|uniref:Cistern family PEP-CTERM protein n=1 Tax=Erythrobacter fulvus TaxID=2987523 RepID=A0ABT5JQZ5_9SPHN|nr:cistern family PEP-CTERM protein [Erythrobacter fulvus]MDC8755197.1 cistern family PEP-CTERM protein [Erythrobacter fulvus]